MDKRTSAFGWLYERAELNGIEMWGTGAALDHSTVPEGFYCYDLYCVGEKQDKEHVFISKNPVSEQCVGAVLSTTPLSFRDKEFLSLKGMYLFEEECLKPLKEITGQAAAMTEDMPQSGFQMQGIS